MHYRVRNPEPEPPRKHSGKEKLSFNRKKPWAGPGLKGGTFLLRDGQVKDKNERQDRENKEKIENTYINYAAREYNMEAPTS